MMDLPGYLKICDIFIRPSLSEGLGNSFLEAMVAGIPVIATPVGGIPDFLFDPEKNPDKESTGLFCEIRNPESIAKQVLRLIENSELRARIINNAKAMTIKKYDWDKIAQEFKTSLNKKARFAQACVDCCYRLAEVPPGFTILSWQSIVHPRKPIKYW